MKKISSLACAFALLFSLTSIPAAYAMENTHMIVDQSPMTNSSRNNMNNYPSNEGAMNDFKMNSTNNSTNNQMDRYKATSNTSNNYRTNAVDNNNDRGSNWGWLGLLGLTGLLGLRSRQRERS